MSTLTANTPSLEEHCQHKLPSSCRLTASSECCACQDKRSHSSTYSTYVDGVGMVSRGTRWQRYCWFCKEFWVNRVQLEGIDPKQTNVPDVPDQTEFCRQWFEYQRGYRITSAVEGAEIREPVACEIPWRDTAPGYLPVFEQPAHLAAFQPIQAEPSQPHIPIEQALDELSDSSDEDRFENGPIQAGPNVPGQQRRAREEVSPTRRNPPTDDQLHEARNRLQEAVSHQRQLQADLADAQIEIRACRERQRQLTTARQTARNLERVFGSREEFLHQGPNYVSPVSAMFARAQGWYQTAEEVRRAERDSQENEEQHEQALASFSRREFVSRMIERARQGAELREAATTQDPQSLDDERIVRPPPKTDAEMNISLACRICLQQVSNTAVFPCGHLVMCEFCAIIAIPTKDQAQAQPTRRHATCPLCRKSVKRVAKVYVS